MTHPLFATIRDHYNACATGIADSAKAMGWYSAFTQRLRFDVIGYAVDLSEKDILDVGCGDGALFQYLIDTGISATYKGIDISPEMIARAQSRFPDIDVCCTNIASYDQSHDVVIASGAFAIGDKNAPLDFLDTLVCQLYACSRSHVVFNVLSEHASIKEPLFCYYNPSDVLDICFKYTDYVTLNHAYLPNDFTIHMVNTESL